MKKLLLLVVFCFLSLPAFTTEVEQDTDDRCWGYCLVTYGFILFQPPEYQELTCKDMFSFVHRKVRNNKDYSKEELRQAVVDECGQYNTGEEPYRYEACLDGGAQAIFCFAKTDGKMLQRLSSACQKTQVIVTR